MSEPGVVLTDYGLAVECVLFGWLLWRKRARSEMANLFMLFFVSSGVAAFTGGTVHGFFLREDSMAGIVLWRVALLTLGLASFTAWSIGATLLLPAGKARVIKLAAAVECVVYGLIILSVSQHFWIAIANYAPAVVFLFIAFSVAYHKDRRRPVLSGLIGLALTIAAAIVQQTRIALHPVYFNHNALYHVIQASALMLIFWSAWYFISVGPAPRRG